MITGAFAKSPRECTVPKAEFDQQPTEVIQSLLDDVLEKFQSGQWDLSRVPQDDDRHCSVPVRVEEICRFVRMSAVASQDRHSIYAWSQALLLLSRMQKGCNEQIRAEIKALQDTLVDRWPELAGSAERQVKLEWEIVQGGHDPIMSSRIKS